MDHSVHNKLVSFIWSIADDCLRDVYVRGKYRDVILPMVVLRRLDTLLEPTKQQVLDEVREQKEEQDFIEFNLLKYIDILSELELINLTFYEQIKYGSSDKKIITLLKNGFSIELAKCITQENYINYISIDNQKDEIIISENIIKEMEINGENKILIFEIKYHINQK